MLRVADHAKSKSRVYAAICAEDRDDTAGAIPAASNTTTDGAPGKSRCRSCRSSPRRAGFELSPYSHATTDVKPAARSDSSKVRALYKKRCPQPWNARFISKQPTTCSSAVIAPGVL